MDDKRKVKRKKRKKAPRKLRYRGRQKRPGVAEAMKRCWADPEWRAKLLEKRQAIIPFKRSTSRMGVPDGMHREEAYPLNQAAIESAKETMSKLKKAGAIGDLDAKAEEALTTAVEIMRKPGNKGTQLSAARLVLEYTKSKPAAKSDITVNKAEEWLAAITDADDKGEASKDA